MIQTRQNKNGKWWCNATIFGYDHSFEANTLHDAQQQMRKLIISKGESPMDYKWDKPMYFKAEPKEKKPPVTYRSSRIDNL